jgi:hypothetical protein
MRCVELLKLRWKELNWFFCRFSAEINSKNLARLDVWVCWSLVCWRVDLLMCYVLIDVLCELMCWCLCWCVDVMGVGMLMFVLMCWRCVDVLVGLLMRWDAVGAVMMFIASEWRTHPSEPMSMPIARDALNKPLKHTLTCFQRELKSTEMYSSFYECVSIAVRMFFTVLFECSHWSTLMRFIVLFECASRSWMMFFGLLNAFHSFRFPWLFWTRSRGLLDSFQLFVWMRVSGPLQCVHWFIWNASRSVGPI